MVVTPSRPALCTSPYVDRRDCRAPVLTAAVVFSFLVVRRPAEDDRWVSAGDRRAQRAVRRHRMLLQPEELRRPQALHHRLRMFLRAAARHVRRRRADDHRRADHEPRLRRRGDDVRLQQSHVQRIFRVSRHAVRVSTHRTIR